MNRNHNLLLGYIRALAIQASRKGHHQLAMVSSTVNSPIVTKPASAAASNIAAGPVLFRPHWFTDAPGT